MTDTDTLARHEAKTEPPKRWKNRWLVTVSVIGHCSACGATDIIRAAGDEYVSHCLSWPTPEEARRWAEAAIKSGIKGRQKYLGPIPEPAP